MDSVCTSKQWEIQQSVSPRIKPRSFALFVILALNLGSFPEILAELLGPTPQAAVGQLKTQELSQEALGNLVRNKDREEHSQVLEVVRGSLIGLNGERMIEGSKAGTVTTTRATTNGAFEGNDTNKSAKASRPTLLGVKRCATGLARRPRQRKLGTTVKLMLKELECKRESEAEGGLGKGLERLRSLEGE